MTTDNPRPHRRRPLTIAIGAAVALVVAAALLVPRLLADDATPAADTTPSASPSHTTELTADVFAAAPELIRPGETESFDSVVREDTWEHAECPVSGAAAEGCHRAVEALFTTADGQFRITALVLAYDDKDRATAAYELINLEDRAGDVFDFQPEARQDGQYWWKLSRLRVFVVATTAGRADGRDLTAEQDERADDLAGALGEHISVYLREHYA
ncbi:hypothetical protein [Phytomonospora endophytica]|uniref:Uncharacterized protein n=1 Tax=Phytomonospora endophytica TaxID=714109 RepID=A0A841G5J5_9ACTN|nr:hypothetical protein [Phytomonospora endophytica]MBB6039370.1 hypothetical protein [Phytomonospora endophytica]GIG69688.1 hypothetical protein Pen01_59830 [Phytomonospora endophytica]